MIQRRPFPIVGSILNPVNSFNRNNYANISQNVEQQYTEGEEGSESDSEEEWDWEPEYDAEAKRWALNLRAAPKRELVESTDPSRTCLDHVGAWDRDRLAPMRLRRGVSQPAS